MFLCPVHHLCPHLHHNFGTDYATRPRRRISQLQRQIPLQINRSLINRHLPASACLNKSPVNHSVIEPWQWHPPDHIINYNIIVTL